MRKLSTPIRLWRMAVWLALSVIAPHVGAQAPASSSASAATAFKEISAAAQVARMGAGVNILGYDPYWKDGGQGNYREEHFKAIRDAGFGTVRVVLFTFRHLRADGTLDPAWLDKLDWVVAMGRRHGLDMILDVHDFDDCARNIASCTPRLEQAWSQLAPRYADQPNTLLFELLNEPHGQLDAAAWNALLPRLLRVVRASNPTRNVVVGPAGWNGFRYLEQLQLPEDDRHLIATFHYYEPFAFTHQDADWVEEQFRVLKDVPFGTPEQIAQVGKDFDVVKAWSLAHDRPVLLGEFGPYDTAPMDSRVHWTSTVARAAQARGFAYAYWQFSSDFLLYDFSRQAWVEPILRAVVPESKALAR